MIEEIPKLDLSEYEIIGNLGEGAFGRVYLIQHKNTKNQYAAKETYKQYDPNDVKQDFNKEIITYSKVHSPAILKIHGYSSKNFQNQNYPIIVTEYMKNSSLDKYYKPDEPPPIELSPSQKYKILLGIALGMKTLHANSIIHRDLKPGNILLDSNFYPHICDFGISYISDLQASQILMNSQVGTPLYQAPEVLLDEPYTNKVDVFSFSFIAYQIITGEQPIVTIKGRKKITPFQLQLDIINGKRPNINLIKDKAIKDFLELSWSSVSSKRPSFDMIVEEILSEKYQNFFGVTDDEIEEYLNLFDDSIKNNFSTSRLILNYKKNDDPDSLFHLAVMYDQGDNGIEIDKKMAAQYYRQACEKGSSEAMLAYCKKLLKGDGIPVDKEEAARIYKDFADKGNVKAMNNYGLMLFFGNGIDKDKEKAAEYLKKSADNGNPKAMFFYGHILEIGDGIPIDKKLAAQYYKASADQGNSNAMLNYAEMRLNGDGIAMNKKEAAFYYDLFASMGDSRASYNLGIMMLIGDGIPKDKQKAAVLMRDAAEQDNIDAMFNYGVMLFLGDGIKMDKKEGLKYIKMAADSGNQNAKKFLENETKKSKTSKPTDNKDISSDSSEDENKNEFASPDLSKFTVYFRRLVSPLFIDAAEATRIKKVTKDEVSNADIIIYDGTLAFEKYLHFNPTKRLNKIPGIHNYCCFSYLFKCLNEMKMKYSTIFQGTFPKTFILPDEKNDFIEEINESDLAPWVFKTDRNTNYGILFVDDPKNFEIPNAKSVIQPFISPYLYDNHKFDIRVYVMLTNLKPLTLFIYKDCIAYFCLEPFSKPTKENRDSYSFNKKRTNSNSIRIGNEIIQEISNKQHKNQTIWEKIIQISALSILSIYKHILNKVKEACESNDREFTTLNEKDKIHPFHRFFNLFGIDFIIDDQLNPLIIGLNENPGMKELNEFDKFTKIELIKNEFILMSSLINDPNSKVQNWTKILPSKNHKINIISNNIMNEIDRISPRKKRVPSSPNISFIDDDDDDD